VSANSSHIAGTSLFVPELALPPGKNSALPNQTLPPENSARSKRIS